MPDMNKIANRIRNNPALKGFKVEVINLTQEQIKKLNNPIPSADTVTVKPNVPVGKKQNAPEGTLSTKSVAFSDLQDYLSGKITRQQLEQRMK